ncbi:hypothetical protein AB0G15_36820 [Streptosporangium sp. NPDC023825]|uniref:hypothetical protein n=1 Tax=Streptosporangium sp. NPDC023825 TaxID=3154909 RepID=UPI003423447F
MARAPTDIDELVEHWTILDEERDLITGERGGPAKVAALLATCGVEVKRRVGGLEEAQRERLLTAFAG